MKRLKVLLSMVAVASLIATGHAWATPSTGFREIDGEMFDDWQISRTRVFGDDGFYQVSETTFRPVIAFESLGENAALAYNLGRQFADKYPDETQRAEKIFYFVRDRVRYTPDIDQFKRDEFALNADELANTIDQNGVGYGDCEDSTILLAVMYKGAGYRSAVAIAPGHTAPLIHLPGYKKAATIFKLDSESGWVWAEATGSNNPLGWIPKQFANVKLAAYEITEEEIVPAKPIKAPAVAVAGAGGGGVSFQPLPFTSVIGFLWLMSLFRRRR
ncbi:transglutaminase domain-containing protein [Chloroflexota bacterium]